jgi:DNA-binding transcriptional LysR family regulator
MAPLFAGNNMPSLQEIIALEERMDRLQAMAVFRGVAEHGGLAAAARQLGLSPAAVTRAIAGLEARLGARLLTRTTRRVALTDAGRRYLADCRRILAEIEEAEAAASGSHATAEGELVVTAPTQFGRLHLGPALPGLLERYPALAVRLILLDRVVDLVEEGIDVALRIGPLATPSLVAVRLGEVRRVVVAAPAYLEQMGAPRAPGDLARHRLVAPTSLMSGESWGFVVDGKPARVRVTARLAASQPDVAIDAARAGFGLTRVPIYQVAADLREGTLEVVLEAFEEPPVPVSLVTVEGRRAAAKVRAFVDVMTPLLRAVLREAVTTGP